MIIVLTVILIATGLVYYFGFYTPSTSYDFDQFDSETAESVVGKIEFDVDFFKEPRFQSLRIYGQWPIEGELETGRTNPFLSFETKIPESEEQETEQESTSTEEIQE